MAQKINPAQKRIPVARVNGTVINEYQVETALERLLDPYKDTKGKVRLSQPEQYAARKQVIDNLIMRELLFQEGSRKGMLATEEEIAKATELSLKEYGSEQQFKAMLVMSGSSPAEFHDQLEKDIIINKTAASIVEGKKKDITTQDARKYYNKHLKEMQGPEVRKLLHIMLPLDRYAPPEQERQARERLEAVRSSSKEFERMVQDGPPPGSDMRAENLGFIMRGQFHPLLDSVAFRMKQGEVSRVMRSDEGLHIMLVKAVLEEGKPRPFELIEDELKQKLYEMNSVAMIDEFTGKLRKKAHIDILDRIAESKLEQEQPEE